MGPAQHIDLAGVGSGFGMCPDCAGRRRILWASKYPVKNIDLILYASNRMISKPEFTCLSCWECVRRRLGRVSDRAHKPDLAAQQDAAVNPAKAIAYTAAQRRENYTMTYVPGSTNPKKYTVTYSPAEYYPLSENTLYLPFPEGELVNAPSLKGEPVPFDFSTLVD